MTANVSPAREAAPARLQKLCNDMGIDGENRYEGAVPRRQKGLQAPCTSKEIMQKCILCRRCVAACQQQHVAVIGANNRGFDTEIGCAFEMPLSEVACVSCGQCIVSSARQVPSPKRTIPSRLSMPSTIRKRSLSCRRSGCRAALGEEFGMPIGTNVEGKMVAALRRLGFDKVYDTDFGADMTIMEEANEFIDRVKNGGKLPIITSCSPGWVKFCEHYFPSPQKTSPPASPRSR